MKIKRYSAQFQAFIFAVLVVAGILSCRQPAQAQVVPVISDASPNGAVQSRSPIASLGPHSGF
jgi:hypothetical protein